jgi:hypothetical protein
LDLNQKYADHQRAVLMASAAPSDVVRKTHIAAANLIAGQIERHQLKLGAAASCAWSISKRGTADCNAAEPLGINP